jgi:hypothetical protein
MKLKPRTYKVQAYKELTSVREGDIVSWAVSMLENGYDGENLRKLAGFILPFSYFEVVEYLEKALKELQIPLIYGKKAILKYTSDVIADLLDGFKSYEELVKELSELCINNDCMKELYDFYLLDNAIKDFEHGEEQSHWPDPSINKQNIEDTVLSVSKKWRQRFEADEFKFDA